MTRQDIITEARFMLNETEGKPGFENPFQWNRLCDRATDELARLDCLYLTVQTDIVSGTQSYTLPQLHRITAVVVVTPDGQPYTVELIVPELMDQRNANWRSTTGTPQGNCYQAVKQGTNAFLLYPPPDYSIADGLTVEGFSVPSVAGNGGTNMWPNATDECPLPTRVHDQIPFGIAYYRCMQYATPENLARLSIFKEQWEDFKNMFMRELEEGSDAERFGDAPDRGAMLMGQSFGYGTL